MPGLRREPLFIERVARKAQSGFALDAGGRVPGDALLNGGRVAAGRAGSNGRVSLVGRRHFSEVLKPAGVAPEESYELTYIPVDPPHWPNVFAGGAVQLPDVDWSVNGQTLLIETGMGLRADDVLWCHYDYLAGLPTAPAEPVPEGSGFIAAASSGVDADAVAVSIPGSRRAGDLLVYAVARRQVTIPPPGWTLLSTQTIPLNDTVPSAYFAIYTKVSDGTEASVGTTHAVRDWLIGTVLVYRGPSSVSASQPSSLDGTAGPETFTLTPLGGAGGRVVHVVYHDGSARGTDENFTGPEHLSQRSKTVGGRFVMGVWDETTAAPAAWPFTTTSSPTESIWLARSLLLS